MSYYYTVREYAAIKGFDLSLQDEKETVASATTLSNKLGVPINKTYCRNSDMDKSCYATRVLRQAFKPIGEKVSQQETATEQV